MTRRKLYGPTVWNLAGNVVPLLVGLYAIPKLIAGMGGSRFGLLTIVWVLIGYFGIFDLGLGRAITQAVAQALGSKREHEARELFWTGTTLLTVVGLVGAALFAVVGRPLLMRVFELPAELHDELHLALAWVAVAVPFVTLASATKGLLEAHGRFTMLNVIRIPYGALTFVLPLLFPASLQDLADLTAQLVVLRILLAGFQFVACRNLRLGTPIRPTRAVVGRLLKFGGWMTLSNVVSPLMSSLDRFVIGAFVSVSVVAYYTTPYEIVMRILVLPAALTTTLFPVLGRGLVEDTEGAKQLYARSSNVLAVVLFTACFVASAFGYDLMQLWVGGAFAEQSRGVLIALILGVLFNGLAYLPYTLLQSAGNARATSLTHLAEFVVYVPLLVLLVAKAGIIGAAVAWTLRALVDLALLQWQVARFLGKAWSPGVVVAPLALAACLASIPLVPALWVRVVLSVIAVAGGATFGLGVWSPRQKVAHGVGA
jgi:O-antigen/teichoic acid export membrane protein